VEENVNNDDAVLILGHSLKVKAERKLTIIPLLLKKYFIVQKPQLLLSDK
jgi:hypothetical protein